MKQYPIIIYFTVLSSLLFCTEISVSGGGGSSETINAKVIVIDTIATVIDENGANAGLVLETFSTDYRPYEKTGISKMTRFDKDIKTAFLPIPGNYNFLIRNEEKNLACFIQNISIEKGGVDSIPCVLTPERFVNGKVISQTGDTIKGTYVVSVQGSPYVCITDDKQEFSLKEIPGGSYTMTVRPKEQRLFIANAKFEFTISGTENGKLLNVTLP